MAIAYRSGATGINTATCTKPAGTASGDLLLAHVYCGSAGVTVTGPSGWTRQARTTNGTIPVESTVWSLVAGGSEPSSYTWGATGGNYTDVCIDSYTGVDGTTPMDATAVIQANASSGSPVSPSITTATANAWAVNGMWVGNGTITAPSGNNARENFDSSVACNDFVQAAAGATGTKTWTVSAAQVTVTSTTALRPAGGGGGFTTIARRMLAPVSRVGERRPMGWGFRRLAAA